MWTTLRGTRGIVYSKTWDDGMEYITSISALPTFHPSTGIAKSHEELRWEDWQERVRNMEAARPTPFHAGAPTVMSSASGPAASSGSAAASPMSGSGPVPAAPGAATVMMMTPAYGYTLPPTPSGQPTMTSPPSSSAPTPHARPQSSGGPSIPASGVFGSVAAPSNSPLFAFQSSPHFVFGARASNSPAAQNGSLCVNYEKTYDLDSMYGCPQYFMSISAMPRYTSLFSTDKSHEELRWTDWQSGISCCMDATVAGGAAAGPGRTQQQRPQPHPQAQQPRHPQQPLAQQQLMQQPANQQQRLPGSSRGVGAGAFPQGIGPLSTAAGTGEDPCFSTVALGSTPPSFTTAWPQPLPAAAAASRGTASIPYTRIPDPENSSEAGSSSPFAVQCYYVSSISAQLQSQSIIKSHEELRWEDRRAGIRNRASGPPPKPPQLHQNQQHLTAHARVGNPIGAAEPTGTTALSVSSPSTANTTNHNRGRGLPGDNTSVAEARSATAAHGSGNPNPGNLADSRGAAATSSSSNSGDQVDGGLEGKCCICMDKQAVYGFVHTTVMVMHLCLCGDCHEELRRRGKLQNCTVCNGKAISVVKVINT